MKENWLRGFTKEEEVESSEDEMIGNLQSIVIDADKFVDIDTSREPMNIVFIGHVDCGKSTTCGRILVAANAIDAVELKKMKQDAKEAKRESWWIAYVMDINEEEREKGKTVEVGRAYF